MCVRFVCLDCESPLYESVKDGMTKIGTSCHGNLRICAINQTLSLLPVSPTAPQGLWCSLHQGFTILQGDLERQHPGLCVRVWNSPGHQGRNDVTLPEQTTFLYEWRHGFLHLNVCLFRCDFINSRGILWPHTLVLPVLTLHFKGQDADDGEPKKWIHFFYLCQSG